MPATILLLQKLSFLVHWFWRWWYRQPVERVCSIQMFHPPPVMGVFWIVKLQCDVGGHRMNTCHIDGPFCTALRSYFPIGPNRLIMHFHHTLALWQVCLGQLSKKASESWKGCCKKEGLVLFLCALGNQNNPLPSLLSELSSNSILSFSKFYWASVTYQELC